MKQCLYHVRLEGEGRYVDNKPVMGTTQPDWFTVYVVGYTNRPKPRFSQEFVNQFMERANEQKLRHLFSLEPAYCDRD